MNRERAIEILTGLRLDLEARGIARAGVFGSVGRGDAEERSDVDVVISLVPGRRLDIIDLGGVQNLLDEGFDGISVDVVVEPVKLPALRAAIQRDRVDAF